MDVTRRSFLRAAGATAAAIGLHASGLVGIRSVLAAEGGPSVIWLQGQSCSGCSVSLLNSVYYTTIDDLLVNTLDLNYHSTVMAAAGEQAVAAANAARSAGGYVLAIEGSIPTADNGAACSFWEGLSARDGLLQFAERAAYVLAVGTCAAYGGVVAAQPNPTAATSVRALLPGRTVVNLPGCPAHPDWVVGTVAYILQHGSLPALDSQGRPRDYFAREVHKQCPYLDGHEARRLGEPGCLKEIGCRGEKTYGDCPRRKWNSPAAGAVGVSWCAEAGSPCHGCTQPNFPDGMSPFFREGETDDD